MDDTINLGRISLRQIRAFVGVADAGSFTAAAAKLHVTQSAVSLLIRDLESELDLRLLDRSTRSVRLTEAGYEFLYAARRIMVEIQAAMSNSREIATKKRGRVRIAAPTLFASLTLPKVILDYRRRFPGIDVAVLDRTSGSIARMVETGEVDLGVGTTPLPAQALTWDVLLDDEIVLVCPRGHPLAHRRSIRWEDATRFPYIAIAPENGTRQTVDACTAAAGISLKPVYEVASVWTLLGMVSAGLGIGLTTGRVRMLSTYFDFRIRHIVAQRMGRQLVLLRHANRSLSPAAASFRDFIRDSHSAPMRRRAEIRR